MRADTASELDPVAERLLKESRERTRAGAGAREWIVRCLFAVGFLVVAVPLAVFTSTARSPSLLLLLLVGAFAVSSRIQFEVGSGSTIPTELVFVPMLFMLPAGLVPIAVAF